MPIFQKRRWPRFLLDVLRDKVICRLQINREVTIEAGLRDLSRRGAGLRSLSNYDQLAMGDTVVFSSLSEHSDFSILRWQVGTVKWVKPETGEFGLEFTEPLPYAKMTRRIYDTLATERPGKLILT
ncbi:PilZ domain-containing protein [Desulfonatronum thioautotrophicum]|uniref:PilZ domain-containing protein n=1 Tax=Desulfonatronum thioautotrophicum TaxID=617001 RepID=UPI0005EBDEB8|nr:PilZ domain-containing protein [Desulfonatronum thioautotrophicum]